jgi:hypothetical protein
LAAKAWRRARNRRLLRPRTAPSRRTQNARAGAQQRKDIVQNIDFKLAQPESGPAINTGIARVITRRM